MEKMVDQQSKIFFPKAIQFKSFNYFPSPTAGAALPRLGQERGGAASVKGVVREFGRSHNVALAALTAEVERQKEELRKIHNAVNLVAQAVQALVPGDTEEASYD